MRLAGLAIVANLVTLTWVAAQEPPAPFPVLPAATDTTALRAALRIPLDPPGLQYHNGLIYDGWYGMGDLPADVPARIAEIKSQLRADRSDGEPYDELCHCHLFLGNEQDARDCAVRAIELYGQRLESQPNDAELLSRLGNMFSYADRTSEADERLKQAVAADPRCWRGWLTLARINLVTAIRSWEQYREAPESDDRSPLALVPRQMPEILQVAFSQQEKPAPGSSRTAKTDKGQEPRDVQWNNCLEHWDQARSFMAKAFAVAPNEPAVRLNRCTQREFFAVLRATHDRSDLPAAANAKFTNAENLADLRAALAARPDDAGLIGYVTWFECMAARKRMNGVDDPRIAWQTLRLLSERIERLESIAARADGRTAARASVIAASLCRDAGYKFRADVHARFAVASDPDNPQGWEAYLAALADAGQADEYMAVARRCADRFDKAIFSIRLADALERDGKLVEAMRVIERLRVREPNDVTAQLAEATLLLKLGEPAVLQRVYTLLDDVTRAEPDADVRTDCELLRACAQFVRGNAVLGRTMLDDLVRSAPAHPRVKAVATALGD